MLKDDAVNHFIQKGNVVEKLRPKLPYGHGRGEVSQTTETRKEFNGKEGLPSELLKTPDHINFGTYRALEPTSKAQFKDTRDDPLTKKDWEKNQGLKKEIKGEARQGHTLLNKEEHNNKYQKPKEEGVEVNIKPQGWIKGKNEKVALEFNDKTTNHTNFPGHNEKFAQKQNERFDNLKSPNIPVQDKTDYRIKHAGKSPDVAADKQLYQHNLEKGRSGHKFMENPDAKKDTCYNKQFNETLKADGIQEKPHYGKDDKTKDFLYQYHKGYYHNDE
jgi:hypothetical protein